MRCTLSVREEHTENLPKFHYEVHHVTHKLGHRTPADVKLRDVARHAAASVSDDDDDDDEDDAAPPPAAATDHLTPADTAHLSIDSLQTHGRPLVAPARQHATSFLSTDKKFDDDEHSNSDSEADKHADVRDSTKDDNYYEEYERDSDETQNDAGPVAAARSESASSNNSPSPISDVYFVGNTSTRTLCPFMVLSYFIAVCC